MYNLAQKINTQSWASFSTNSSNVKSPMFGLIQCYEDLSQTDCQLCFAASRTRLPTCIPSVSASLFLDGCFLRYDNYSFYEEPLNPKLNGRNCSTNNGKVDVNQRSEFAKSVRTVIDEAMEKGLKNGGFGVAEVNDRKRMNKLYALAQCWKTVSATGCKACLNKASEQVTQCVPSREGRGFNAGCYLRYSTNKFYGDHNHTRGHHGLHRHGYIAAIILASAAMLMFLSFSSYLVYIRYSKWKKEENEVSRRFAKVGLNFNYEVLEEATNFFDLSNKLGQGGAGIVFKGTLPNGQAIAVKRLFFNTTQWANEFFNEVNLIRHVQHKNLVKLLGCSIEGPESLLVYEFVPKKSLDHYLFGAQSLDWKQRVQIIVGTAEGLAYLHGGTQTRIIHRDIKCSNILLDEDFIPKIADFGLVRSIASGRSHLSTGIAGTLGYMAPEYLVRGQLTEKADVYSFGVIVLEIISSRKNVFIQESQSLLQSVWNLYRLGRHYECVDPYLGTEFQEEVLKVLHIGLLCTQASVPLRPSMAQ
uniref:Cysteine-rich receptor-like protein kinase 42 n=2 Tax=Chenopodium quinoa TaxID=63459 RepID=A0A803KPK6_CHEQI